MSRSLWQESFVPVVLVVLSIFLSLLFVQYEVARETNQATVIVIADNATNTDSVDGEEEDNSEEEVVTAATTDDPERTRILKLIDERHWHEAEQALQMRLAADASSETLADFGMLYYRQRQYDKALDYLNRAIATKPLYASAYFYRGFVYSRRGELKKAIADYRRQIELTPFHFEAHYNLGLAEFRAKDYRAASRTLEHAATLAGGKRKGKTFYNLGLALSHRGADFREKAAQAFNAAIRLQPDYIAPRFGLASLEPDNEAGQQRALKQYETVLRLRPNYAPAYLRMGLAYSALGDTKASIAAYRQAIQYNPAYTKAHYNLGLQLINARKWSEAAQQFEWILERNPDHARSHFNLGRIANGRKDYAAALDHYRKAQALRHGNYPAALVNMGLILAEQRQYDKAITAYNDAIRLRPDYASAWYSMGMAQQQVGKMAESERSLKTAIRHKPAYLQAWTDLGALYVGEGRPDEAIRAYRQALQRADYQPAQLALAALYEQQKQYDDAITLYGAVLHRYPSYVLVWQKLGAAHLATDRYGEAEDALRRALHLDPQNVEVKRLLAKVMLKRRLYGEATGLLSEAVEAETSRADLRLEYAQALEAAGDIKAARAELEKGLRLEPDNRELQQAMKSLGK